MLFVRWDMSPEAFSIGKIEIRYYGLMLLTAFIVMSFVFYTILKKEGRSIFLLPLTANAVFLGGLIGARLGECLFYHPAYFVKNPIEIIIPFKDGSYSGLYGLSGHGAGIGILIAVYLLSRNKRLSFLYLTDRTAVAAALGIVFIRIGNLMNSEMPGLPTDMPWGFIYAQRGETFARHPIQLYEATAYLIVFTILSKLFFKNVLNPGIILGLFMTLIFTGRFVLEFLKAPLNNFDEESFLSTGQYLCLPYIFSGLIVLMHSIMKPRTEYRTY